MNVEVFADLEALADAAADWIAKMLLDAPGERASLGISGGSTPAATYERLRGMPAGWERVDAWLADERWVPQNDADSNGRMAEDLLLSHVNATFYRPRWAPWLEPEESAAHYEAVLRSIHPTAGPDLVVLGIGTDGHTASLFPGTAALSIKRRWYVANEVPHLATWRLTTSIPFLHRAKRLCFLVAGAEKAEALGRVAAGEDLPATLVAEGVADTTWLIDRAAAANLST